MRVPSAFVWAFIPWSAFWQKEGGSLHDSTSIHFGFSASSTCTQVDRVYRGKVALQMVTQLKGLSHRTQPLGEAEAMLFVNPSLKPVAFWMLRTYIPLDIAYYDSNGRMDGVHHMPVEPDPLHPKKRYRSGANIQVSIEMKPGVHERLWFHPYLCIERKSP